MKTVYTLLSFSLLGAAANAASIVQTQNFSFVPDGSQTLTFNEFDTMGGTRTLLSVTITTSLTKSGGSLYVDNDAALGAQGTISQSVTIDLSATDVTLLSTTLGAIGNNVIATSSYFASVEGDDGDGANYQEGGLDWGGTTFTVPTTVSRTEEVHSLAIDSFKGTGTTFAVKIDGTQGMSTSAISGAAGTFTPSTASGYVTVTYNYVPEPSSWIIVCGGLGAGLFVRRRRA